MNGVSEEERDGVLLLASSFARSPFAAMNRSRLLLVAALLSLSGPVLAHDLPMGGSRWCIGPNRITAAIDLDTSLLERIEGVREAISSLQPAPVAALPPRAVAAVQHDLDRTLTITVNGAARPAHVERIVKPDDVWQVWLSIDALGLDRPANTLRIDYRLLLEETNGTHVNMAYFYLSSDEATDAQRLFDFTQPTWQTAFERGSTTWEATIAGRPRPALAAQRAEEPRRPGQAAPVERAAIAAPSNAVPPDAASPAVPERREAWWSQMVRFVLLGIEHILSGYDHIAFLLALIALVDLLRGHHHVRVGRAEPDLEDVSIDGSGAGLLCRGADGPPAAMELHRPRPRLPALERPAPERGPSDRCLRAVRARPRRRRAGTERSRARAPSRPRRALPRA